MSAPKFSFLPKLNILLLETNVSLIKILILTTILIVSFLRTWSVSSQSLAFVSIHWRCLMSEWMDG